MQSLDVQSVKVARSDRGQLPRQRPRFSSNGFFTKFALDKIYIDHSHRSPWQDLGNFENVGWYIYGPVASTAVFEICLNFVNS